MWGIRFLLTLLFLNIFVNLFAQNCKFEISGVVKDTDTGLLLEGVTIYSNQLEFGVLTDSSGQFKMSNICNGNYHFQFSHIGCESVDLFLDIVKDTFIEINLDHSINILNGVVVTGSSSPPSTQNTNIINQQTISDNASQNLSSILASISGVSTIKNGSGIAKPVVHGLYGNRITILNNGIAQSGQQWGNDHSPEIDPLVANKIRVIKGVSTLEYFGANLGSLIMVEPKKIGKDPHLHGKASYFFETNGLSHGTNLQLQQNSPFIAWKINGTFKRSGDHKTPDYFLTNSGNREYNIALQLEKKLSDQFFTDFYFSSFNTELGVLRGAHVGNLTDLQEALEREVPFFTRDTFSYSIDAPKQKVNHHLGKLNAKYFFDDTQWLELTIAGQLNNRKEFDVRKSGRSDIPAMSLKQISFFTAVNYSKEYENDLKFKTGLQFNIIDNTNDPETGIFPLIPDYLAFKSGVFFTGSKKVKRSLFEFGLRYDNVVQDVAAISNSEPREIVRYNNTYHNFSLSGGLHYDLSDALDVTYNIGFATRNPAVNELYSGGLHQGVSGIEEGNVDLKSEESLKTTLGLNGKIKFLSFETVLYYQNINDYIFLEPQDEIRLTIRGAFPVFKYEQTDAEIFGLDFSSQVQMSKSLSAKLSYSFIRGNNISDNVPLINIPSNNLMTSLKYEFPTLKIRNLNLNNFYIEMEYKYVFKQDHLLRSQDFVAAPAAYGLLNFRTAVDVPFGNLRGRFFVQVDNMSNVRYRDYLNRQRYFADDLGINFKVGASVKF